MAKSDPKPTGWQKVLTLLREETAGIHPRLIALNMAQRFLPSHQAQHARARLFSFAGFRVGNGTRIAATPRINGGPDLFSKLIIGQGCAIEAGCVFDLGDQITIGDRVVLSPGVMILTSTHELDIREHRAGDLQFAPVVIGDGVWLGARSIILPGVKVGAGAIVNPGSVVQKDVPPQTRVGGSPATRLEVLQSNEVAIP